MTLMFCRVALAMGLALAGCDDRPAIAVDGVHRPCPAAGCAAGQDCVTGQTPEGPVSTCEIRCARDRDCPDGWTCTLPPVAPGALAEVCEEGGGDLAAPS